jgi:hypothetical protein
MLLTPPASRPRSWLKISVVGDGSFDAPRYLGTRLWSVRGPPVGRPLTHSQGSGGQVRAPCPLAVVGTDDLESRVAIALSRNPELSRSDGFRQMQQVGVATEV